MIQAIVVSLMILSLVMSFFTPDAAATQQSALPTPPVLPTGTSTVARSTVVLYDGALNTGTPDTQGFVYLTYPFVGPLAIQSFANGVTTLSTTLRMSDDAGYFARQMLYPPLDRVRGYQVLFTTQVVTETHANNNRAGFSVLILSHDKQGIELGFWTNEIWAQEGGTSNLFTHAESATLDTTADLISYRLVILGDTYSLSTDGFTVLTGSLRDYTAAITPFPINPYTIPDLIFLGDDTSSAQGAIRLSAVSVIDAPPFRTYLPLLVKN